MAATGEERIVSELRTCRESLGQVRNELATSLGQFQIQVTGLRDSLTHAQQNYRDLQGQLDQLQQNSTELEIQVQAAKNLGTRLEQMEATIQRIETAPLAGPAAPLHGLDPVALKNALRGLTAASTQEEILEKFLDFSAAKVRRAILFANKTDRFVAWQGRGFPSDALDSVVVDDPNDPIMTVAGTRRMMYREQAPAEARPSLGEAGDLPHAFVAIPLVFDELVPVILYADSASSIDVDYLEVLSYLAVLVLKNHGLQQFAAGSESAEMLVPEVAAPEPAPAAPAVTDAATAAEPAAAAVSQDVQAAFGPPPVEASEAEAMAQPEAAAEPQTLAAQQLAAEPWEIPESMRDERSSGQKLAEEKPSFITEPLAPPTAVSEPEPAAIPTSAPEVPAQPVPALSPEEDEKYNNEARRFARLLVSEIKLYNEDEVYNGRQNGDLYLRLKRDIDRSRDMYEKRVNAAVARTADHFHEELVRILAREDANLMGAAYPGPMIRG